MVLGLRLLYRRLGPGEMFEPRAERGEVPSWSSGSEPMWTEPSLSFSSIFLFTFKRCIMQY